MTDLRIAKDIPLHVPPVLYVVATPIGNLSDFSLRAIEVLKSVDIIFCEDTRHTLQLARHFNITTRLERLDQNVSEKKLEFWVNEILEKKLKAAYVSDAGTPGVSDPISHFLKYVYEKENSISGEGFSQSEGDENIKVVPIPGCSAVSAFVSVSGSQSTSYLFRGFFPRDYKQQVQELNLFLKQSSFVHQCIWFESPQRVLKTVEFLNGFKKASSLKFVFAKELTKKFEKVFIGNRCLEAVLEELKTQGEKGEWIFSIESKEMVEEEVSGAWMLALECLLEEGVSVKSASERVSHKFGIPKKLVYSEALNKKNRES